MNTSNGIFSSSFIYGDLADNQKSDKLDWKHISELFFYIVAMTIKYLIFPTFTYNFWLYVMAYHIFLIILTLCDRQKKLYPFFSVLYFVLFGPLAIKFCHCFISAAILLTFAGPFMSLVYFRMKRLTQLHFVVEGIKVIFLYPKLVREVIEDRELDIQTLLYQECASLCLGLLSINFLIVMVYKQLCKYEANMNTYREKIEQVNISLQESLRERENFILSLSHDVRNLLNIIIGNTELAFEDATDPGIKEKLKSTKVCGDLLLSLINNVLDAGKIDLGNVEVCHSESMIRPTIEKLWHTCHELIKKKNLTGELKIFNNVPECLMLDQHRLNQILFNLIVNSVKFTEKGSIKLRISWSQEEDDPNDVAEENCQLDEEIKCRSNKLYSSISKPINQEGYLKIEVIDSGPGIPSDAQENLFKKYQQLSNSSQQRKLGTGLGLWITKNICDKMNGKIRVTSQIGIGTTFTVTLKTKVAAAPRLTRQPTFVIPMSTVKLLIVEDDRFCAQIITRYIRDSNLPIEIVAIAENGFEAVNIYKEYFKKGERIDVITMDLEMEIMGGKEACKQIRDYELKNNIRPTKIFIISANCLDKEVNECTDTKGLIRADGFLRKPLESSELMTHLARVNVEPEERFSNIKHILIVDDDGFNQKLLEEMLTKQKIKTILASNGKQALEICQKRLKDISLVIMDCEMPEMDGWKATSAIKALCQDLNVDCPPIYGLTGHSSQEIEERCMAAGMSKVLKKPIAYNELVQNVKCLNARCTAQ